MAMLEQIKKFYRDHGEGEIFSIIPLLFLAVVVYLQQAWVPGFFHDGYLYAAFGKHASELGHWLIPHLNNSTYAEFPDHSPFLFILEGLFFTVVGSGETQARLFGAFFSLSTVVFLYLFVEKETSRKRAFYTTLLFITIYPLIKKTRFPNMDIAIMLTMMMALFSYYRGKWYLCGFFSGISMLIKGPIAFLIPLSIGVHLLITKGWSRLKSPSPWFAFLLTFLIFSIWPLALYLSGRFDIFQKYIHSTFFHTISDSRGLESYQFHAYLVFLAKQTPHILILLVLSLIKKKDDLTKFALSVFSTIFIFLTLQKLKYSHYLIPLYPFYALAVGGICLNLKEKLDQRITFGVKVLAGSAALVLLIFPLTTEIKRDRPLYETKEIVERLKVKPNAWAIVGDSYPFFAATNFFAYYYHAEVYRVHDSMMNAFMVGDDLNPHVIKDFPHETNNYRWGFLARLEHVKSWRERFDNFDNVFKTVVYFEKKNIVLLLPKIYFNDNALFKLP